MIIFNWCYYKLSGHFLLILCFFRFQVQTQMFKCKLSDFQAALEEAILAESAGMGSISAEIPYPEAYPTRLQEASCSSQDLDFYTQQQASFLFLFSVLSS